MKRIVIIGLTALMFLVAGGASAQTCPLNGTNTNKLVCLIPQVYGPFGFGNTPNPTESVLFTGDHHEAHFANDFLTTFAPINEAVGIQVSQLPIASPSSGITFIYDPSLKTFAPSTDESLGPILGDRATTIGKHKLFLGFSYQYFNFSTIDGKNLNNIPSVLQHQPFTPEPPTIPGCPVQTSLTGTAYEGDPCFVRDYIQTSNNIDLTTNQYTIYLTYGITSRLDFSAAIPILDVRMAVISRATIVPNSVAPAAINAPGNVWHSFNPSNPALTSQCASQVPCLNATFSDSSSAVGIGDVVLRGKYTVYKGERLAVAAGVDVRLPSGDATNFLGSGATGVEPFGVISYRARVTPHASVGYEINGDSVLAGTNIVPGATNPVAKGSLPNRLLYIVGADVRVTRRLTGAFDLYGQRLFGSPELVSEPYTDHGNCSGSTNALAVNCAVYTPGTTHPDVAQQITDVNVLDASLGLKYRVWGRLVLTGNVLLKLDDGGLRSRVVPLVGASYSF
ncbi:MAG TPA: transporter [Candidatus Acidoferrales bacterium]|nr:transporter [Candidatus Acidoferrales bacterium]